MLSAMNKNMQFRNQAYYCFRCLMPRRFQIRVRQIIAARIHRKCSGTWPILSSAAAKPIHWKGWPGGKQFALVLTHDVDTGRGQDRCLELKGLEQEYGFVSSFNFVAERYSVNAALRDQLAQEGFEVGVHGLHHDGKLYQSWKTFQARAAKINDYLREWNAVGFRSPAMHHNLDWIHLLNIEYDASTFDTDPFEPQPDGMETIFPFWVRGTPPRPGYVELPYTLPQDFTLFVLLQERTCRIWEKKLDWIAARGGMALVNTHPDYMNFSRKSRAADEYPAQRYRDLLTIIKNKYRNKYWLVLPRTMATFWRESMAVPDGRQKVR